MSWWHSVLLGLVQGLAEFLPVSSSGHLVLLRQLMNLNGNYLTFDIVVHVGTVAAVFVVFFREIVGLFRPPFKKLGLLALASIPAVVAGIFLDDPIGALFSDATYLCFFFLVSAIVMLSAEIIGRRVKEPKPLGVKAALFMGLAQAVAIFPGVTRSGSTIFAGLAAKGDRKEVAKFSFLMSIPIILGAACFTGLKLLVHSDSVSDAVPVDWWCYVLGAVTAFVSGFAAVKLMLRLIAKADFKWFSLYLVLLSVTTFIAYFVFGV